MARRRLWGDMTDSEDEIEDVTTDAKQSDGDEPVPGPPAGPPPAARPAPWRVGAPVPGPPPGPRPAPWLVPEVIPEPVAPAWAPVMHEEFHFEGRPVRWGTDWRFWGLTILIDCASGRPSRGGHTHHFPRAMRGHSVTWHVASDQRNNKWLTVADV
jgi:hypothetical protein